MSSKSKKKRSQRSARNKASHSTLAPEPSSLFDDAIALGIQDEIEKNSDAEPAKPARSPGRSNNPDSLLSDFSFTDEPPARTGRQTTPGNSSIAPVSFAIEPEPSPKQAQVSLLSDFWKDTEEDEDTEKEDARLNDLFTESVINSKSNGKNSDESLSKRIQVGLYPADADLLEELYQQSKSAGLKNVSRARILRVALRHFHTCWLNADQS